MSRHRGRTAGKRRGPRRRSGRVRALLSLGIVLVVGVTATSASWVDSATIATGPVSAGTLDVTANTTTAAQGQRLVGAGSASGTDAASLWTYTELALTDMIPGESVSVTLVLRNNGTAPFTVNGNVVTTGDGLVSGTDGLRVRIYDESSAATRTGTATQGNRAGTCTVESSLVYDQYVSTASAGTAVFASTGPRLTAAGTRSLCVRISLPSTAPTGLQGASTQVLIRLSAVQASA